MIINLLLRNTLHNKSTYVHYTNENTEFSGHFVTIDLYGHSVLEKMESHNLICLNKRNRNVALREVNTFDMNITNGTIFQT